MSIKISAVAFLDSESLKLLLMPMGVLQLSEIDLIYFNKFPSALQAVMITWEVFSKKHWMTFWYTWADKITTKEGFLSWMSMIFLQQVLQTLLKRGLGF